MSIIRFDQCEGVVVISSETRLRARVERLLDQLNVSVLKFSSLDEFQHSTIRDHAVIMAEDHLSCHALENLRKMCSVPRLVLVSQAKVQQNVVTAFYSGADFYFNIAESDFLLAAQLQAALRGYNEKVQSNIVAPPYQFHVQSGKVFLENQAIALTPMEYKFAAYLFSRPEVVVKKAVLMQSIWSLPRWVDSRRVDTAASRLRLKMKLSRHLTGWELVNIRNVGFKVSASTAPIS